MRAIVHKGVKKQAAKAFREAVRKFEKVVEVTHFLDVHVVPAPAVCVYDGDKKTGFGVFAPPTFPREDGNPAIYVAGDLGVVMKDNNPPAGDALHMIASTLAHELVHYEQFRDGKPLNHRGLARRANAILTEAGYRFHKTGCWQ